MNRLITRFYLLLSNMLVWVAKRSTAAAGYFTSKARMRIV